MILIIDNFDSFVHNLGRYIGLCGDQYSTYRNDVLSLDQIAEMRPAGIVISPGPCGPEDAGISCDVISRFAQSIPILGVCLGHQCIANVFGGRVYRSASPVHGRASRISHNSAGLFQSMEQNFMAGRYHSLEVQVPEDSALKVTATSDDGVIMGISHDIFPLHGVQFHPESILTENGHTLIQNFTQLVKKISENKRADNA